MHILCTICSDLVNQAESLYVTKCGHIFHHQCLAQWIERSKSCPQCRNKVTEKCMFRMYPTVSNENSGEDAATLQSRLDDAMLQLRTQRVAQTELQDKLTAATQDLNKKDELLKAAEKRLVSRESAVAALREQLDYVKLQNKDTQRLREENEALTKNMQTLNGLQKVLNATASEVEDTLRGYSDTRTLATFAAALKRALCESEAKKRSSRELQRGAEQRLAAQRARLDEAQAQLGQMQEKLVEMERKYEALQHKRKASADAPRDAKLHKRAPPSPSPSPSSSPSPDTAHHTPGSSFNDAIIAEKDTSFGTVVSRIMSAQSPYLRLKQGGLALPAPAPRRAHSYSLKPSEFALLSSAPTSIFHRPAAADRDSAVRDPAGRADPARAPPPHDGLGGHAAPDTFPVPARPLVPRLSSKHRLKRLQPAGSRDIAQMFARHDK